MKVSPYDFKKQPRDLVDFKDDVTYILNYGKYAAQIVTSQPWWIAREGEHCYRFEANSSGGHNYYSYFWINSGWVWIKWTGSGGAISHKIHDYDEDTIVDTERFSDEDVIRFTNKSSDSLTVDQNGDVYIQTDNRLAFNGTSKSYYWMYSVSADYLQAFVSGALRMEM